MISVKKNWTHDRQQSAAAVSFVTADPLPQSKLGLGRAKNRLGFGIFGLPVTGLYCYN